MAWLIGGLVLMFVLARSHAAPAQRTAAQQVLITAASTFMLADVRAGTATAVPGLNVTVAQADASTDPDLVDKAANTIDAMGYHMTALALHANAYRLRNGMDDHWRSALDTVTAQARQYLPEFGSQLAA